MTINTKLSIFYQARNFHTIINDEDHTSIFQGDSRPIAERTSNATDNNISFFSLDTLGTPVNITGNEGTLEKVFSPYGYTAKKHQESTLIGFAGEPLIITEKYLLGSYRLYSPFLMRFLSPDSLSPFAKGGVNAFCYCGNDPINYSDASGYFRIRSFLGHTFRPKLPKLTFPQSDNIAPPSYQEAIKPIDNFNPPTYKQALAMFPDERSNIISTASNLSTEKFQPLVNQYESYIKQQQVKQSFATNQAADHFRKMNRLTHGSDSWLFYNVARQREMDKIWHYEQKIAIIKSEKQTLQDYLATLRHR